MNGAKHSPCESCPFRTNIPAVVTKSRAQEIADAIRSDAWFACHKTLDYRDGSGGRTTRRSVFCRGALIVMEREGVLDQNQMARIEMRLGMFDPRNLDLEAPVPASLYEWIERHVDRGARK